MHAIQTQRLTKRFRELRGYRDLIFYPWRESTRTAVADVDLEIGEGEVFGLLGENGAGKTTLIRMLSTTLIPTSGRAMVGGHDVAHDPHAVRRVLGLVSGDERTFYWRLTGRQNLDFFAALYHVPRRQADSRIRRLLETLGVSDDADRPFHAYSTGTRQKFAIARGLLTEPRILFLDEPTRALDPIAADDVRRYVVEHISRELGATVLMATHTLSEAEAICHRVGIVRHGRLIAVGTMSELSARMSLSKQLDVTVADRDPLPAPAVESLRTLHGTEIETTLSPSGVTTLHLAIGPEPDAVTRVLAAVVRSGIRVESAATRLPTLEDVYRAAHVD